MLSINYFGLVNLKVYFALFLYTAVFNTVLFLYTAVFNTVLFLYTAVFNTVLRILRIDFMLGWLVFSLVIKSKGSKNKYKYKSSIKIYKSSINRHLKLLSNDRAYEYIYDLGHNILEIYNVLLQINQK